MFRLPLPTEAELVSRLRRGEIAFPPMRLGWKESKAKETVGFHAHQANEALFLEDASIAAELRGRRSTGDPYTATVFVPEAFPYLLMKLTAYADRKADANKDLGRHHALDAYTIVGMMTEPEYDRARPPARRPESLGPALHPGLRRRGR
jgi:hypothetical protein